jgi:ATP-dependent protease ClpP protease subunit
MPTNAVFGRYYDDRFVVTLVGPIHNGSIIDLCIEISEAVNYYYYTLIEIEIASQGGEVSALEYLLDHLQEWRQSRPVRFATKALTTAASAAAVILSLGDAGLRCAQASTTLLYHEIRIVNEVATVMDQKQLKIAQQHLQKVNQSLIERLTRHIYTSKIASERDIQGEYVWKQMPALKSDFRQPINGTVSTADLTTIHCGDEPHLSYEQILQVYQNLFALDLPITPTLAMQMALIDTVVGGEK